MAMLNNQRVASIAYICPTQGLGCHCWWFFPIVPTPPTVALSPYLWVWSSCRMGSKAKQPHCDTHQRGASTGANFCRLGSMFFSWPIWRKKVAEHHDLLMGTWEPWFRLDLPTPKWWVSSRFVGSLVHARWNQITQCRAEDQDDTPWHVQLTQPIVLDQGAEQIGWTWGDLAIFGDFWIKTEGCQLVFELNMEGLNLIPRSATQLPSLFCRIQLVP